MRTIAYQATQSPVYALLAVALALLLRGRKRLLAVIRGLTDKLGKPTTDHFGYTLLALGLLNTAILFYGFFGLWLLWADLFPVLRILDQVTLWHHTVTVDGEAQVLPVTLASVDLALFYAVITVILAKQLPAVLEIILLKFSEISAGGHYTVTTLTNYVVVTTGAVLVFQTLGTDWSQLQWRVAALGVGIGFGLQEIVANFLRAVAAKDIADALDRFPWATEPRGSVV